MTTPLPDPTIKLSEFEPSGLQPKREAPKPLPDVAEIMRLVNDRLVAEYDFGFQTGRKDTPAQALYARLDQTHAALEAKVTELAAEVAWLREQLRVAKELC